MTVVIPPQTTPVVTALPSNAIIGQQVAFQADATNGVYWNFIYDGVGTYPWKFIGGPAMRSSVSGNVATSSPTGTASSGPSLTLPLAGDYEATIGASAACGTGAAAGTSIRFASTDITYGWMLLAGPGFNQSVETTAVGTASTSGVTAASYIWSPQSISITFTNRWIAVTPIRAKA